MNSEYARSIENLSEVMIASTSHDMRTPLNTIIAMHQMMKDKVEEPNILEYLNIANTSTSLLLFLVNDTLDYF